MKRVLIAAVVSLSLCVSAQAGWNGSPESGGFAVYPPSGGGAGYTGPGDIVSGAKAFWGLQAYSAAYAAGGGKLANACLPSAGSCFDITANTTTGLPIIPVGLATCNNSTIICTIQTVYDQSGALACAGSTNCDLTNATEANRPKLVVAGAANGCPNTSLPCIKNGGGSLCSANSLTLAQPFSVVAVVTRTANFTITQRVLTNTAVSSQMSFTTSPNTIGVFYGGSTSITITDGTWMSAQGVFNGTSSSMNANSVSSGAGSAGTGAFGSIICFMDDNTSGSDQPLFGNTGEAGIWGIAFSGAQISAMNTNAHSAGRWNF